MFYVADEKTDCENNFEKFFSSADTSLTDESEYKWIILYLFMFLQSLFIIALCHSNPFPIIKGKHNSKTKNGKKYTLKMESSIDTLLKKPFFVIEQVDDSIIIRIPPFFGSKKSIHELAETLEKQNINISEKQIQSSYNQICKLLPISNLYIKIKKIIPTNKEMEQALYTLIDLRNTFIHFSPSLWLIDEILIKKVIVYCSQLSLTLVESENIKEYKIDKNKIIMGLNKIVEKFR